MNVNLTPRVRQALSQLHRDDSGQDLLEYALVLITVLAAVVVGSNDVAALLVNGMTNIGTRLSSLVG